MTRRTGLAWGASALLASQLFIAVGQFVYSGITSRLFSPNIFGEYTIAISLQAVAMVLTTSGFAAFLMGLDVLSTADKRQARLLAILAGLLGATAYLLTSPAWFDLTSSPLSAQFSAWLAVSLLLNPIAITENTIMRRNRSAGLDAVVLVFCFVASAGISVLGVTTTRDAAWLASAPAANAAVLLLISLLSNCLHPEAPRLGPTWSILSFRTGVRRVSAVAGQNLVFQVLYQTPVWTLSVGNGTTSLGFYARAVTLTNLPSGALATAMLRLLQPSWRNIRRRKQTVVAFQDVLTICTSVSATVFFTLAAVASHIVPLWLGPGWDGAIEPAQTLALSAAFFVPYSVLISALEVHGRLSLIRWTQATYAGTLALGLLVFVITSHIEWVPRAVLAAQVVSLILLLALTSRSLVGSPLALLTAVTKPACWAVPVALSAYVGANLQWPSSLGLAGDLERTCAGLVLASCVWVLLIRWQNLISVMSRRGLRLPAILTWRPIR